MAEITFELPYISQYFDNRNGKRVRRYQFRRKGHKKVLLKGKHGSAEFMEQYHALVAQTGGGMPEIGTSRTKAGTIDALIVRYLKHERFTKGLAVATQGMRRPTSTTSVSSKRLGPTLWREPADDDAAEEHRRRARRQDAQRAEELVENRCAT